MAESDGAPTPASHLTAAPGLLSGRPAVRLRSFTFLNFKTGLVMEPYS